MDLVAEAFAEAKASLQEDLPLVTITWAQSLDGKLSTAPGERTLISGPESMEMTHGLRALHDGIVVGSNTVLTDKPRLTTRLSPQATSSLSSTLSRLNCAPTALLNPVPIILDSHLRTPSSTPCLHTDLPNSHLPLVMTHSSTDDHKLHGLAKVIRTEAAAEGKVGLSLLSALRAIRREGINSVMVEGGAGVLSSFVDDGLWDIAVVTVAPTLFGAGAAMRGPAASANSFKGARFERVRWVQMGADGVVIGFRA